MLVLRTLQLGPAHGFAIALSIGRRSDEVLLVEEGSLYPALHRLERHRWIAAEWQLSDNRQRVRVYRLTPAGRKHLAAERSRWDQLSHAVAALFVRPAAEET